jgi:hypothetical protein
MTVDPLDVGAKKERYPGRLVSEILGFNEQRR